MLSSLQSPDLLSRIPLAARTVLDVGCGDGALAGAYRMFNPRVRLLGIEWDPDLAHAAAEHMDQVAVADVETDPLPFDAPDGFDCIIYSGILEHLRDPWALVQCHAEALSRDGMMLISVPNMEHWRFTERLLRGNWNEPGDPVPDFAHLRWFTLNQMREQLDYIGLSLCDVTLHEADPHSGDGFAEALTPALNALGIDPTDYATRARPSHLIWRVCKREPQRFMLYGSMLAPVGGVSHVRVVHPLQAIGTDPAFTTSVTDKIHPRAPGDETPRILVLHRPAFAGQHGIDTLRMIRNAGYLVITEFDDHPDHFAMMQRGGDVNFRGVHAVQTSTPVMAEIMRQYNPEVATFPNAIPVLPDVANFADPHALTVFFGALNRERDWQSLMPAINAVAQLAGDRLRFQVVHDQGFFEALDTPHKFFTPTCDYETYLQILGASEISFMPLSDTAFNRAKSDLKFIEAGACRVTPLASHVVYADSIEDGRTGQLFRDPRELHMALLRFVAMPDLARNIADAARAYVTEQRMLAYQVEARIAWYRSLWERRAELTDAIEARMAAQVQPAA